MFPISNYFKWEFWTKSVLFSVISIKIAINRRLRIPSSYERMRWHHISSVTVLPTEPMFTASIFLAWSGRFGKVIPVIDLIWSDQREGDFSLGLFPSALPFTISFFSIVSVPVLICPKYLKIDGKKNSCADSKF